MDRAGGIQHDSDLDVGNGLISRSSRLSTKSAAWTVFDLMHHELRLLHKERDVRRGSPNWGSGKAELAGMLNRTTRLIPNFQPRSH